MTTHTVTTRPRPVSRKALVALLATAAAIGVIPSRADAHRCRHRHVHYYDNCGCTSPSYNGCPVPVQVYYHPWASTVRLVRSQIFELPDGYRMVCINGIHYYYYDRGPYSGCYFRALGETASVSYICPP